MVLLNMRRKHTTGILFVLIGMAVFAGMSLFASDSWAAGAPRSLVYGFRHTDNKQATQLITQLGLKVTVDAHSSTVVVLTGEDPLELKKAYSLMEVCDRKEPVSLKTFGAIPEATAEADIKQVHSQLNGLNVGTFLDPPTKTAAAPFIVDVYQGKLIAIATTEELEKIEKAYQAYRAKEKQNSPEAAITEPNEIKPRQKEPNLPMPLPVVAEEPNTPQPKPTPAPQPMKSAGTEPNNTAAVGTDASVPQAAVVAAAPAEPNQAGAKESLTQEDFMSSELLQTLAAEEKTKQPETPAATTEAAKAEITKETKVQAASSSESAIEPAKEVKSAAATESTKTTKETKTETATAAAASVPAGVTKTETTTVTETKTTTQSLEPAKANAIKEPPAGETADADLKNIIEQLKKTTQQEEKAAEAETAAKAQELPQEQPIASKDKVQEETTAAGAKAEEPAAGKSEIKADPSAKTQAEAKSEKAAASGKVKSESSAAGQKVKPASAEQVIPKGEEELELTITLPEKVEIKNLIELVGKQLGLNYIYDETKVRGEVMLKIHDGKIKVKDCYALLETVLRFKGFVMTRRGNLVTIVPIAEAPTTDTKIRTPDEPIEPGDVIINSVYALKHINYNTAMGILRQLNLGTTIIPIAETNTLIITDYSYRMEKIEQVLRILDVPGKPKTYVHRSLQYMQAADLIPRLQKLASQLENLSITVGTTAAPSMPSAGAPMRIDPRTGQPMGNPQPTPNPQAGASQAQVVFLEADERTNRILMIGSEDQLKTVNGLIDSLDVRQYNLRFVKEYEIKYVDASEVISVLNELSLVSIATPQGTGQTGRPGGPQAGGSPMNRPGMPQQQPQQMAQRSAAAGGAGATESADQPSVSIRPNTNSLLVNATEEQHEDIQLVIQYIDVEQKDQRTIKEYEIQNVDVQEIVQTLGDLGIISKQSVSNITSSKSSMYSGTSGSGMGTSRMSGGTNRVTGMPMDQGAPEQSAVASLLTAEGGTVKELITTEPQMSILESTNSLLIHATPRQHASIALVIAHVDRELDRMSTPYVVYPLESQKPEDLAATLTDLIEGTMSKTSLSPSPGAGGPSAGNKIQTEQTGGSNLPKKEEERIRIVPDEASYSLIVFANKKNQQWVATLIKQLDQYRPQVLLDCTLVEITKDDQFNFDLSLVSRSSGFPPGGTMTNLTAIKSPFPNSGGTEATVTSGVGKAFYADDHIQALLSMINQKGYGRVLARPSILVKDNEEGIIKTENVIYVAEPTSTSSAGTTPDTTTTTTNVNFKDYTAGITLTITPHIASEKLMQLEIVLDRTDFTGSDKTLTINGTVYTYPKNTITSNVDTWSIVPSGATIILGGIEKVDQTKMNNKVPILGDIPLVGLLFRGISQTDVQSKLYIFVKANIIQAGDELTGHSDIEQISRKKRDAFEVDESRFQGLEALPGPKPTPMIPSKILEDDEYIQRLREQQAQKEAAAQEMQEEPVN
jgi:type II secretory pathway component GspD/PulD (secretin)